jgi:hypothetical protein
MLECEVTVLPASDWSSAANLGQVLCTLVCTMVEKFNFSQYLFKYLLTRFKRCRVWRRKFDHQLMQSKSLRKQCLFLSHLYFQNVVRLFSCSARGQNAFIKYQAIKPCVVYVSYIAKIYFLRHNVSKYLPLSPACCNSQSMHCPTPLPLQLEANWKLLLVTCKILNIHKYMKALTYIM